MSRLRVGLVGAALVLTSVGVAPSAAYRRPASATPMKTLANVDVQTSGSRQTVTADARYVVFATRTQMVAADKDDMYDVYLYDLRTKRAELVSGPEQLKAGGVEPPAAGLPYEVYDYSVASVTPDGRHVVFRRYGPKELGQANVLDAVLVWSRASRATEVVSVDDAGLPFWLSQNNQTPTISDDGRRVAMTVRTPVAEDELGRDVVVVRDRAAGRIAYRVRGIGGSPPDAPSEEPSISGDGRFVVFQSAAGNLHPAYEPEVPLLCQLPVTDCGQSTQLWVAEITTGKLELASVDAHGTPIGGALARISRDGRYIAWPSYWPPTVSGRSVVVRDRRLKTIEGVAVSSAGEVAPLHVPQVTLSPDGRYIIMSRQLYSYFEPIYIHDRVIGVTESLGFKAGGWTASFAGTSGVIAYFGQAGGTNNRVYDENDKPLIGPFLYDHGPVRGVQHLTVRRAGSRLRVSGTVTVGGATLLRVADAANDPTQGNDEMGQDLRGFDVIQRVEDESLLLRWRVDKMPSTLFPGELPATYNRLGLQVFAPPPRMGGDARVTYQAQFTVNGTPYEVRASRVSAALPDAADLTPQKMQELARFDLFRCDELSCMKVASLRGGIGTAGHEVRVRLPWSVLRAKPGAVLKNLQAGVTLNSTGVFLDRTSRPATAVSHKPAVSLRTISTRGKASGWVPATLTNGAFSGTVAAAAKLQVRVCLGSSCTVHNRTL